MTTVFSPHPQVLAPTTTGALFPVRRVFFVGQNYAAHSREMGGNPEREAPFFFTAWAETVVPGGGVIPWPSATGDYHHEVELVAAIGAGGRDIAAERALDHVWGYAVGLDMTRRDLQAVAKQKGRPWDVSKNVERAKPLGAIRPASDGFDPGGGAISLSVNGEARQSGDLSDMIWPVADVVATLSTFYRLEPGDLIFTGTPAGVGPVRPGDVLAASVEGLPPLSVTIGAQGEGA